MILVTKQAYICMLSREFHCFILPWESSPHILPNNTNIYTILNLQKNMFNPQSIQKRKILTLACFARRDQYEFHATASADELAFSEELHEENRRIQPEKTVWHFSNFHTCSQILWMLVILVNSVALTSVFLAAFLGVQILKTKKNWYLTIQKQIHQ